MIDSVCSMQTNCWLVILLRLRPLLSTWNLLTLAYSEVAFVDRLPCRAVAAVGWAGNSVACETSWPAAYLQILLPAWKTQHRLDSVCMHTLFTSHTRKRSSRGRTFPSWPQQLLLLTGCGFTFKEFYSMKMSLFSTRRPILNPTMCLCIATFLWHSLWSQYKC